MSAVSKPTRVRHSCPSQRRRYSTVKDAVKQLEGHTDSRAYRCFLCHGYHLTSLPLTQQGVPSGT